MYNIISRILSNIDNYLSKSWASLLHENKDSNTVLYVCCVVTVEGVQLGHWDWVWLTTLSDSTFDLLIRIHNIYKNITFLIRLKYGEGETFYT